jgi:non-heme chloroperoxidase
VTLTPGWPDDPDSVAEAKSTPRCSPASRSGRSPTTSTRWSRLDKKPAIIGHSFGGLLTQILAGRGLSAASVSFDSAPFRGILPLPISTLKSGKPVLGNPANRGRAVPLTYDQFRYSFANTFSEEEAMRLYNEFSVPGAGVPLFQAAAANFNPWSEAKVDHKNADRGPMPIAYGGEDHVSPKEINKAIYDKRKENKGVTELVEIEGASHGLTIGTGWRDVCDTALEFVQRFVRGSRARRLGLIARAIEEFGPASGTDADTAREQVVAEIGGFATGANYLIDGGLIKAT